MSIDTAELSKLLSPWMGVETWYTGHPMDMERFHRVLQSMFNKYGYGLDGDSFSEAMHIFAEEHLNNFDREYLERQVSDFSLLAENIGSYLFDINKR